MNSKYKVINLFRSIPWIAFAIVACLAIYIALFQIIQFSHRSYFESLDGKQIPIVVETSDSIVLSLLQNAEITEPSALSSSTYIGNDIFLQPDSVSEYFKSTILVEKWRVTMYRGDSLLVLYCPYLQIQINVPFLLTEKYIGTFTLGPSLIDEDFVRVGNTDNFAIQLSYHPPNLSGGYFGVYVVFVIALVVVCAFLMYFMQIISFPFIRFKYKEYYFYHKEKHYSHNRKLKECDLNRLFEVRWSDSKGQVKMLVITTLDNHRIYFFQPKE